jgi:DNA-binding response OmpR family regulator
MEDAPDLVVLDLGLPDGSGLTLCRELRTEGSVIPILILTARSQVALRVEGLDAGADDYLAKPFALAELRARVRALGRRSSGSSAVQLRGLRQVRGDLVLDFGTRTATRAKTAVPITARQWAILELLASRGGRIVPRSDLLEIVWGDASDANANSLEVLIARLRKKLGADVIRTLRGEGYAFGSEP